MTTRPQDGAAGPDRANLPQLPDVDNISLDQGRAVLNAFVLRVAGASGAIMLITSTPWIGNVSDECVLAERFCITFAGDSRSVDLRDREFSEADLLGLRDFLSAAMTQDMPQFTVPKFEAAHSGFSARVLESTSDSVGLEFSAHCYLDDDDQPDLEGIAFDTGRLALWEAVCLLDRRLGLGASAPDDASELGSL